MGVTDVFFRDYAIGCIGFIPGTVAFVFIGTTASGLLGDSEDEEEVSEDGNNANVQLIVGIVGGIATVIAVVLISVYAKRALNKVLEEDRVEQEALEMGLEGGAGGMNNMDQSAQDGSRPSVVEHAVRVP
ncbi:unnamed protein product [Ectocarpus fasciculatus]